MKTKPEKDDFLPLSEGLVRMVDPNTLAVILIWVGIISTSIVVVGIIAKICGCIGGLTNQMGYTAF